MPAGFSPDGGDIVGSRRGPSHRVVLFKGVPSVQFSLEHESHFTIVMVSLRAGNLGSSPGLISCARRALSSVRRPRIQGYKGGENRPRIEERPDVMIWQELTKEISSCTRCPLSETRTQAVVYRGSLAPLVLFVGEAPGAAEDRTGLPFVGRSGKLLDVAIERVRLASDSFGVLNLIKCRPPRNRFDSRAARECRPFLERQISFLRPSIIVTLGARALEAFLPDALPILSSAGTPRQYRDVNLFPLIHPAASFRSSALRERWARDLAAFERYIAGWLAQTL